MVNDSSLEILQLFQLIELQYLIHHDAFLIKKKTKQNKTNKTKKLPVWKRPKTERFDTKP